MQKFIQKYVLVTLLEDLQEGVEFTSSNWPLHVTIASNFSVECGVSELLEQLSIIVGQLRPIKITAGKDELFGPQRQVRVTILSMNEELRSFHNDLVALMKSVGAVFDEPAYIEVGYRAHATVQREVRLQEGDNVIIDKISLIDMFPNNDPYRRKIIKTLKFLDGKTST